MDLKAMHKISYGLYVIGAKKDNLINAQTANSVIQISADPVTVAVSINKKNLTHEYILADGYFTVSILEKDTPLSLIGLFGFKSGRETNKFSDTEYAVTTNGLPYITGNALAYMEAKVINTLDAGTHTIFLGQIIAANSLKSGEPMTYAYYHQVKSGSAPALLNKKERSSNKMDKYVCNVCGYVYDPEAGDAENNIAPGTPFADLPEDWVCPVCGVGKDEFEKDN